MDGARGRGRHRSVPRLALLGTVALVAGAGLSGCTGDTPAAVPRPDPAVTPGGPSFSPAPVPRRAMSRMEEPVARQLSRVAHRRGLTLQHLDCPGWDRTVPAELRCRGWFDGVVGTVRVTLRGEGDGVGFDAMIVAGVVATRTLVERLRERGDRDVDCGPRPAYPARVGLEVSCLVGRGSDARVVVARVTGEDGAVAFEER